MMGSTAKAQPQFGHTFRSHFLFSDDYLPMNHGMKSSAFSSLIHPFLLRLWGNIGNGSPNIA